MGLGAIAEQRLGTEVTIHEDARAFEMELYHLAATLDRADTTLVWLNSVDPDVDATIAALQYLPGTRLVVAIAGPDREKRKRMNRPVTEALMESRHTSRESVNIVDVDSRFTTSEQWIEYLRQLPKTRPSDLYVRFRLNGHEIDVHEGEQTVHKPWYLFVAKVYTPGVPGELSQLAVAREHCAITRQMVVDSTRLIASRNIGITS
jgi:hypothetical protein